MPGWWAAALPGLLAQTAITQTFIAHGAESHRAAAVAQAVWHEAPRHGADPLLVAAIITVENPDLLPRASSSAGARGLMQVMPRWSRVFRMRCGSNLLDTRTNICTGIAVLKEHIRSAGGSLDRGLLGYNGCVKTPGCARYPRLVLARHRRLQTLLRL